MVLRSFADRDDWNAIDPNVVIEDENRIWLSWGSFWGGIKMRRLDPATGKPSAVDTTMYSLAARSRDQPIGGSVEAPFIVKHGDYWYLFVSFDRCCRGAMSTYNIRVGRSQQITGPYVDRDGTAMTNGGGSLVLDATTPAWRGPGHNAFLREGPDDYLVFHAYPAEGRGSSLFISTVVWENGWPRAAPLP
jgi:arabinan endo-1,5-alpha-L-arabinosidase